MVRIGLIGDFNQGVVAHQAIPVALRLAGGGEVEARWMSTAGIREGDELAGCDGVWCVPASPYASMQGALAGIRYARERGVPFLGTCGGFQHALIEYARNVLGRSDADHAETSPEAERPLISRLSCALVEERGEILLEPGSRVAALYGRERIVEGYHCSFGLNPAWERRLIDGGLLVTGRDRAGEARVVELPGHPFFMATLFQPERSALGGERHPLISAFVAAAHGHSRERGNPG